MQPQPFTFKNVHDFVSQTTKLLVSEQEQQKELFQQMVSNKTISEIQQEGGGLSNMVITDAKEGFYGKIIITLTKAYYSQKNKIKMAENCKIQNGDDVGVYVNNKMVCEGVVYKKTPQKIKISVRQDDQTFNLDGLKVNIILKWNQVTYKRYFHILKELQNSPHHFIDLLFPTHQLQPLKPVKSISIPQNSAINKKQNEAIFHGLTQTCHLIHGPPGTGKTTTVSQLIIEAVKKGEKVLACAPSNIGVDNIVQKIGRKTDCVRVGNPSRMTGDVVERSLDFLIRKKESLWKGQIKKVQSLRKKLNRSNNKVQKKGIYQQIKTIQKEINLIYEQIIQQTLQDTEVICTTNAGAADRVFRKYLSKRVFDLVVIDECGQGLEVSCWIPLLKGKRVVLAGDHKQLPPTVKFQENTVLSYTLFSRAMTQLKYLTSTMLEIQYRMNNLIMGWSNSQFYDNKLKADESVSDHTLDQLYENVEKSIILLIDTAGCKMGEDGQSNQSKMNKGEGDIILSVYQKLLKCKVSPHHISILSPYSKQVSLIKNLVQSLELPTVQVSTVDGIQGRQKQCILISLVRSNPSKEIGFLKDWRRMNVAVTRARRMLIVVGDSDCMNNNEILKSLVNWIEKHGQIQSAMEFQQDETVRFGLGKVEEEEVKEKGERKKRQKKKKKQIKQEKVEKQQKKIKILSSFDQEKEERQKYYQVLSQMEKQIVFTNVNGWQRRIIHQIAEEFGYHHETSQDKKSLTVKHIEKKQQTEKEEEVEKVNVEQKPIIQQTQKQKQPSKIEEKKEKNMKKQKAKKKKQKKQETEEDIDELLNEFMNGGVKKDECYECKKKLSSTRTRVCKYCKYNFCQYHLLAEQHGCDFEAQQQAQRTKVDKFIEEGSQKIKEKLKQQEDKRKKKKKQK